MPIGLKFQESLRGVYHRLEDPGDELEIAIDFHTTIPSAARFLLSPVAVLEGTITAQGLAQQRPLRGDLEIRLLVDPRARYDFVFEDEGGEEHRFRGEKEIVPARLVETITTLPGSIYRGEKEVARALLRFELKGEFLRFLTSLRLGPQVGAQAGTPEPKG